jgi:tetratricopeptide (TPR) repeat protein
MAKANWKELLGWNADQLEELRFSGFSFLREGKYDKAIIFFKALVIIDPNSIYDFQTLGALYLQIGEGEKALSALNNSLSFEPNHEPTLLNKVKALLLMQRKIEALSLARQLEKSSDPSIAGDAAALLSAYT